MKKLAYYISLLLIAFVANGCGGNNQKLTGTVTFTDDGSPLNAGTVIFECDGKSGRGEIGPDGKFQVGFNSDKDGIPKGGTYKVTIVNAQKDEGLNKSGMSIMTPLIDKKYSDPNRSGFTFTADGKTTTMDLKVDRFVK